MTNSKGVLIDVINQSKPEVLPGLSQKASGLGQVLPSCYKRALRFDVAVVLGGNIRLVNGDYVSTPYEEGTEKSFGGCGLILMLLLKPLL